jgi:hypothetical protein
MRELADAQGSKAIEWVAMRHEADCWIATCAMVAGVAYEVVEQYFGPGADYSQEILESEDPEVRRAANLFRFSSQLDFFIDHGCYPVFLPQVDPPLKPGRRYMLGCKSCDPQRSWMAHAIVVDETGKVFDPDPKFEPTSPKYAIPNYPKLLGWEIIRWDPKP